MLLWLTFALLAGLVGTLLMATPSARPAQNSASGADDPDMAVYKDQLTELDADVERGVVSLTEAASARAEIARRLLKQAGTLKDGPVRDSAVSNDRLLVAAAAIIPAVCLGIYLAVGSPSLPGRPLAERLAAAPESASTDDLVAKVEARLREKPDDGMGWSVLAPVYMSQGRLVDAGRAYERAIGLLGETPDRLAGLAKALVLANNGIVVEPARQAYERLAILDPKRVEARFWLAVSEDQNGRKTVAEAAYRKLLNDAPADAPWRDAVQQRLSALLAPEGANPIAQTAPQPPAASQSAPNPTPPSVAAPVLSPALGAKPPGGGPTPAEFVAAAHGLPAEMRQQMLGRMVERASQTVKATPKDTVAWSRLVTGYQALGRSPDAVAALKEARSALAGDQSALAEFDALAASLGLAS